MDISIIIINYNNFEMTCNCIRSVEEYTQGVNYEIILVDNASTECNPDEFKIKFPKITLVKSEKNGGFAYGNNLGIENSKGDMILLLNNDTLFLENTVMSSLKYFQLHSDAGVIGCRMTYLDNKVQYTSRRFRSINWELLDLFRFILFLVPYKRRAKQMLGKYFRHNENIECDWLNGAFFLFSKKVIALLPHKKLDDRFFMYGEDQLWCEQIKKLGLKNLFFSGSTIVHFGSSSTKPASQIKLRKIMMKHELEIMKLRKGRGVYYYIFATIFGTKERIRNFIKLSIFKLSGRVVR